MCVWASQPSSHLVAQQLQQLQHVGKKSSERWLQKPADDCAEAACR